MKNRKFRIGIGILLIPIIFFSCDPGIVGNGDVETKKKDVGNFNRVDIHGNFDVFLEQTGKTGLRIEADENLFDIIDIDEVGNTLRIRSEVNIIRAKRKNIYIQFDDLKELDLSGALEVRGEGKIKVRSLDIAGSGASDVNLDVEVNWLDIDVSGAGDFDFTGSAKEANLIISGVGGFDLIDLRTEKMNLDISGAAHARVFVTEELDVEISGAGNVRYKGNPEISRSVSGIGSLKKY